MPVCARCTEACRGGWPAFSARVALGARPPNLMAKLVYECGAISVFRTLFGRASRQRRWALKLTMSLVTLALSMPSVTYAQQPKTIYQKNNHGWVNCYPLMRLAIGNWSQDLRCAPRYRSPCHGASFKTDPFKGCDACV